MQAKIFAHRGASKHAPENTMDAFTLAYQEGADGIETDVHLTKDRVPVLMHDERVNRTTNGTGYIKDYTFSQLKKLDAGAWFSPDFAGARILRLDELLEWIDDKSLYLNIELKNNKIDYRHLETIVYDRLSNYRLLHRTILSTFNPISIKKLKTLNQTIGTALLSSKRDKNLVSSAGQLGANAVHIKYQRLQQKLVNSCHHRDMAVRVYTVNKPKQMLHCFRTGCDGIFTDVPKIAIQCRAQIKEESM
ncbi:glycerophosphodiester phosphodiesterase [Lentibacillus amyloliquefaciens]|uniref:Glycerophosphodiester phosphodiesterase n=1 Tax=Lentibacillus amyloliquefaciens TaxID=1472767 RepID=A0A0U3W476_9BACI|nr:glycerophosphodiester phosphodiesterase [Lentibacillus amyloliquefaciens]ALX48018.1 glycerophosphodiester phosphodiesterase [Lentibacillus amyloliquefaciens]